MAPPPPPPASAGRVINSHAARNDLKRSALPIGQSRRRTAAERTAAARSCLMKRPLVRNVVLQRRKTIMIIVSRPSVASAAPDSNQRASGRPTGRQTRRPLGRRQLDSPNEQLGVFVYARLPAPINGTAQVQRRNWPNAINIELRAAAVAAAAAHLAHRGVAGVRAARMRNGAHQLLNAAAAARALKALAVGHSSPSSLSFKWLKVDSRRRYCEALKWTPAKVASARGDRDSFGRVSFARAPPRQNDRFLRKRQSKPLGRASTAAREERRRAANKFACRRRINQVASRSEETTTTKI